MKRNRKHQNGQSTDNTISKYFNKQPAQSRSPPKGNQNTHHLDKKSCLVNHPEKANNVLLDVITNTQNILTDPHSADDIIAGTPVKCGKSNGRKKRTLNEMSCETKEQVASSSLKSVTKTQDIFDEKCDLEDLFCVQESNSASNNYKKSDREELTDDTSKLLEELFTFDDSWDIDTIPDEVDYTLDLSESKRCKIISLKCNVDHTLLLTLKALSNGEKARCTLANFWANTKLQEGDTVHIKGVYDKNCSSWIVNNIAGFIVYEPDILVSTTSVVGALFCKRRSVLAEWYRGFESTNSFMVIGNLVHTLLQQVLQNKSFTYEQIKVITNNLVHNSDNVLTCYNAGIRLEDVEKEMLQFVPKVFEFVSEYVRKKPNTSSVNQHKDNWRGSIDKILDIEENIWCPELGLKGKVDITVQSQLATIPIELKTGRSSMSLEHRGQVMLYMLMMNGYHRNVSSGLLLYLREGVIRELSQNRTEQRDLVMMRNDHAYSITRLPSISEDGRKPLIPPELPEPIDHPGCRKCGYNVICSVFLEKQNIKSNCTISSMAEEVLAHLQAQHVDYFIEWSSLLALEKSYKKRFKDVSEIFTVPPEERESRGQCIAYTTIDDISNSAGCFIHTFKKTDDSDMDFCNTAIENGSYAVVSTDSRPGVATGFVTHLVSKTVSITLDRNLKSHYPNKLFHIDTYSSSMSDGFNLSSLSLLLEDTPRAKQLREIVIDRVPPTFQTKLSQAVITKGASILRSLNRVQQRAVLRALSTNDYLLIKGMPGTGKTATIVTLVELLVKLDQTVLITSHTHSAVDNVCLRLHDRGVNFLRLGSTRKIHPNLHQYSEHELIQNCKTPLDLENVYNKTKVVAVTCLGAGHPLLSKRVMDVCIVDESTQVLQTAVFRPLYTTRKFVLIGDPNQLPPVVKHREASARGLSRSLFDVLDAPESTITLTYNYRMNRTITDLANKLTYENQLLIGNEAVANNSLHLLNHEHFMSTYSNHPWLVKLCDSSLSSAVQVLNTGPTWKSKSSLKQTPSTEAELELEKCTNLYEVKLVLTLVTALEDAGIVHDRIGIMAPFVSQVKEISSSLNRKAVEVSTVDRFQGRDKDVVIYSCTKSVENVASSRKTEFEILEDHRRLTVAVTRAKQKLIVIGDMSTMKYYTPFAKFLRCISESCIIDLSEMKRSVFIEGDL